MSYLDSPGNQLVQQTVRLGRHDRLFEFMTYPEVELFTHAESLARIEAVGNFGKLLQAAEQARVYADSWRGFCVGAAGLAMYFNPNFNRWRYELIHGANAKPHSGHTINVHAEHTLMTKTTELARPVELASLPFVCVIGDLQPDQQTGLASPTLHPCGVCRDAFLEPDTPIGPQTMFVTVSPDMRHFEWYSEGALRNFHESGDKSGMGGYSFQTPPLALTFDLNSAVINGVIQPNMLEDAALVESDQEVAEKIRVPLLQYAYDMQSTPPSV